MKNFRKKFAKSTAEEKATIADNIVKHIIDSLASISAGYADRRDGGIKQPNLDCMDIREMKLYFSQLMTIGMEPEEIREIMRSQVRKERLDHVLAL